VYVGDSTFDMMAANAAGVTSIGVTWGAASHEALRDVNASHLVGTPAELESLLTQLRGAPAT
jgi:pyrophosphatase PpaX